MIMYYILSDDVIHNHLLPTISLFKIMLVLNLPPNPIDNGFQWQDNFKVAEYPNAYVATDSLNSVAVAHGYHDVVLKATTPNDVLFANAGNDTLIGYLGHDTLYGGVGNDVFVVGHQSLILGWDYGDVIQLAYPTPVQVQDCLYTNDGHSYHNAVALVNPINHNVKAIIDGVNSDSFQLRGYIV